MTPTASSWQLMQSANEQLKNVLRRENVFRQQKRAAQGSSGAEASDLCVGDEQAQQLEQLQQVATLPGAFVCLRRGQIKRIKYSVVRARERARTHPSNQVSLVRLLRLPCCCQYVAIMLLALPYASRSSPVSAGQLRTAKVRQAAAAPMLPLRPQQTCERTVTYAASCLVCCITTSNVDVAVVLLFSLLSRLSSWYSLRLRLLIFLSQQRGRDEEDERLD